MPLWNERTAMLLGEAGVETLANKRVAVFGVGGVGGFVCEALARAGVGKLDLFDDDVVATSNLNRQVVALHSTLGQPKVKVMAERIADINPNCKVQVWQVFYLPQNATQFPLNVYDYIVDAVDTVSAKLCLIENAVAANVPVISCMGAGNKLHPERFCVDFVENTSVCPLARVMRKELKKRGITGVKAVYSTEAPLTPKTIKREDHGEAPEVSAPPRPGTPKTITPGSISFVPATAGLVLAGAVVRDLLEN